jgi:MFS family permease
VVFAGLRSIFRNRDFRILFAVFFVGLGLFNAVSTWIEDIVRPRGFTIAQAGLLGGLMLGGGIVGAVVLPLLSDRARRRKPFILLALAGLLPALVGLAFARSAAMLFVSGFVLGFFLLSAGPIGFQYAAEITRPAPEAASMSSLLVAGQVSGIAFILAMDAAKSPATGSMTASILVLAGLMAACLLLAATLRESPIWRA